MKEVIRQSFEKYHWRDSVRKKSCFRFRKSSEYFVAVSLRDVTELNAYIRENEDQRMIAGLIYIDNYDEVMESVEEVMRWFE